MNFAAPYGPDDKKERDASDASKSYLELAEKRA